MWSYKWNKKQTDNGPFNSLLSLYKYLADVLLTCENFTLMMSRIHNNMLISKPSVRGWNAKALKHTINHLSKFMTVTALVWCCITRTNTVKHFMRVLWWSDNITVSQPITTSDMFTSMCLCDRNSIQLKVVLSLQYIDKRSEASFHLHITYFVYTLKIWFFQSGYCATTD